MIEYTLETPEDILGARGQPYTFDINDYFHRVFEGDWETVHLMAFIHSLQNCVYTVGDNEVFPSEDAFRWIVRSDLAGCCHRLNADLRNMEIYLMQHQSMFPNGSSNMRWIIECLPDAIRLPNIEGKVQVNNPTDGREAHISAATLNPAPDSLKRIMKHTGIEAFFGNSYANVRNLQADWECIVRTTVGAVEPQRRGHISLEPPRITPSRLRECETYNDTPVYNQSPPSAPSAEHRRTKSNIASLPFAKKKKIPPVQEDTSEVDTLLEDITGLLDEGGW